MAWVAAAAQEPPAPGLAERQAYADHLMQKEPPETAVDLRFQCISGQAPRVTQRLKGYGYEMPLAPSEECPVVLARVAKDRGLLAAYQSLVAELAGDASTVPGLPAAIGAAVAKGGSPAVAIGNQRGATITPALALDAGFTVAHLKGVQHTAGMPGLAALKPITERCLAQSESNLALCYSTGYVYGARAVSGLPLLQ